MARFFFHLRSPSGRLILDEEGMDLPDLHAAAEEALAAAYTFAEDTQRGGFDYSDWSFEIRSVCGSINLPVSLSEAETG
jgi:hypothetical protein